MAEVAVERERTLFWNRGAVLLAFLMNGALMSNWVVRIPDVQSKIGLTEGTLGLALLGVSVGVLTALPLAGGLISRYSSRRITIIAGLIYCCVMPFLALANSFITLWMALFMFGAMISSMDIAMNAQAVGVEKRVGKTIMSSFHASFSIGTAIGGAMGAVFAHYAVPVFTHFTVVSVLFGAMVIIAALGLIDIEGEKQENSAVFSLPHRSLWGLGLIAFCAAIGEGSMADWSALYLRQVVGVGAGAAGVGFTAFSIFMTIGRLSGDKAAERFNLSGIVRACGITAASGLALAIFMPTYWASIIGFALVGLGMSVVIPLAFSVAGARTDVSPGAGIAGVATIGYAGFLAGPPVIGLVAEVTSLRVGLGVVLVLSLLMAYYSSAMRRS